VVLWIVVAVIVVSLAGLLAAILALGGRMRRLELAQRRAQTQLLERAGRLQPAVEALREQAEALQARLEHTAHRER
jgi:hypothetical protein